MADYYFDGSGLVKRYVVESGSHWVNRVCSPTDSNLIYLSRVGVIEIVAAFTRRSRENSISHTHLNAMISRFFSDLKAQYRISEITAKTTRRTVHLLRKYPLRAYDSVQLSVALWSNERLHASTGRTLIFVSADKTLLSAAEAEGLATENPNDH